MTKVASTRSGDYTFIISCRGEGVLTMDGAKLKEMLEGYKTPGAEAEAKRLGAEAVPLIASAFKTAERFDSMKALWYCRLLDGLDLDIFDAICAVSDGIPSELSLELGWLLRSPRYSANPERVMGRLEAIAGFARDGAPSGDFYLGNYHHAGCLVELLGRSGYGEAAPFLDTLLSHHLKLFDPFKKDYFAVSGEEFLTSSLATVLLCFLESGGVSEFDTDTLVEIAAASFVRARGQSINGPLPLLFVPGRGGSVMILKTIAATLKPVDPLLSDLYSYLATAKEFGLGALVASSGLRPLGWLDLLEQSCDPKSYGPKCALFVRKTLSPESVQGQALDLLSKQFFSPSDLGLILEGADPETCDSRLLPLVCEAKFHVSDPGSSGDWKAINARFAESGNAEVKDWSWVPLRNDEGSGINNRLTSLLDDYFTVLRSPETISDGLREYPAVIRLGGIRLLLCRAMRDKATGRECLKTCLYSIRDAGSLAAAYGLSRRMTPKDEGILMIFMGHPDVGEKWECIEDLVGNAIRFSSGAMKTALVEFAFRLGWGPDKGDYGIWNTLTLHFARVAEERVIPRLVPLSGASTLGSALENAIVNLGERYPEKIDDGVFISAFRRLFADGFTDYGLVFFERRCKALVCELAASDDPEDVRLAAYGINRLLAARKKSLMIPPEALSEFVLRLPEAVRLAKEKPGETWEDRNWGGYTMSAEETYADLLSEAIRGLAALQYAPREKETIRSMTAGLPPAYLVSLELVKSSSFSLDYVGFDLRTALKL